MTEKPRSKPDLFPPADAQARRGVTMVDRFLTRMSTGSPDVWQARSAVEAEKKVIDSLAQLSEKLGIRAPKLLMYRSSRPNAASLINGTLIVSTDLVRTMKPEQLEAVLAHELSHHQHRLKNWGAAMLIGSIAAGAYFAAARGIGSALGLGMKSRTTRIAAALHEEIAPPVVAYVAAQPYRRLTEYEADRESADLTGSPDAMASSLRALERRHQQVHVVEEAQDRQEEKEAAPLERSIIETEHWLKRMVRTARHIADSHPPLGDRIARLEAMRAAEPSEAGLSNQTNLR